MNVKEFASKNEATILSCAAGVGVAATGFCSAKLGMEIEADKEKLKSDNKKVRKAAKLRLALKAGLTLIVAGATEFCIFKADKVNKQEIAKATAVAGLGFKMLKEYRSFVDEEKDKEIMAKMQASHLPEEIPDNKNDENDDGLEEWTDQFVDGLSNHKVKYYRASENDILKAVMALKDTYYDYGETSIAVFYDKLRSLGVDIPVFECEHYITWEANQEREDYYRCVTIDVSWTQLTNKKGQVVNSLIFSDTDEEINNNNAQLESNIKWFCEAKARQDTTEDSPFLRFLI